MLRWLVCLLPLLVACKSSEEPEFKVFQSGSRLRAKVYLAPDGVRVFAGWHDTKLDVDCSFVQLAGGVLRCIPETFSGVYSNASTCEPSIWARPYECWRTPKLISTRRYTSCDESEVRVFRVGGPMEAPAAPFEVESGCKRIASVDGYRDFRALSEIPITELVAAHVVDGGGAGGITVRVIESEDGARQVDSFAGPNGRPCRIVSVEPDGETLCTPDNAAFDVDSYSDASCTKHVAVASPHGCGTDPPEVIYSNERLGQCGGRETFYSVGPLTESLVYQPQDGGTCAQVFDGTMGGWYAFGDRIEPSAFPHFETRAVGTHPSVVQRIVGNAVVQQVAFTDDGVACKPLRVGDELRCVDAIEANDDRLYYADAACTDPIYPLLRRDSCLAPVGKIAILDAFDRCPDGARAVHAYGEPYVGPAFLRSGATCVSNGPTTLEFRRLGRRLVGNEIGPLVTLVTE